MVDLQLYIQPVPITTKVVSSNPAHGEVYLIQHYVIKFVSDLRQVCGFHWVLQDYYLSGPQETGTDPVFIYIHSGYTLHKFNYN
jgi:hypothetical protein